MDWLEQNLDAYRIIAEILVEPGQSVDSGTLLVRLAEPED